MRKHFTRLTVALLTFVVGLFAAAVRLDRPAGVLTDHQSCEAGDVTAPRAPARLGRPAFTFTVTETPEQKAVRLAEEFVARNGYTDLPPDRERLSHESVEWESDVDEMLKQRHNSLERKAYGIYYGGRGRARGWTVVFRPSQRDRYGNEVPGADSSGWGRAVTMDGNFEQLRVEHKDFPLGNVQKRL